MTAKLGSLLSSADPKGLTDQFSASIFKPGLRALGRGSTRKVR